MIEPVTDREASLACERNSRLQCSLVKKRTASVLLCIGCFGIAVVTGVIGSTMIAFCALLVSLICLILYLDANGHLQEVRRRSTKTLVPRFSVLGQKNHVEAATQGQTATQGHP